MWFRGLHLIEMIVDTERLLNRRANRLANRYRRMINRVTPDQCACPHDLQEFNICDLIGNQDVSRFDAFTALVLFVAKPSRYPEQHDYLWSEVSHERLDIAHDRHVRSIGRLHEDNVPGSSPVCLLGEIGGTRDVLAQPEDA